jgi:hypothetical protein
MPSGFRNMRNDEYAGLPSTFAAACRAADKRQRKERRHQEDARALDTSGAAYWTVEALVFALRDGLDAMKHPSNQRRLGELSDKQMKEVAERVQRFMPRIAPAWKSADVEALLSLWSKLR